jgi:large subunit ribosomal protein L27
MAHRKAGGSAKNLRDSNPKYLGTKLGDGQQAVVGSIIIRQRGTKILPGNNTGLGRDHTVFSLIEGTVRFGKKRMIHIDGTKKIKKIVHVDPITA